MRKALEGSVASIRALEPNDAEEWLALRYLLINGTWEDHRMYGITADEHRQLTK